MNQPAKLDWSEQIQKDLNDFKVKLSLEEINSKSTDSFNKLVKDKAFMYKFSKLMLKKQPHSKIEKLSYVKLEMQEYLKQNSISSIGGRT